MGRWKGCRYVETKAWQGSIGEANMNVKIRFEMPRRILDDEKLKEVVSEFLEQVANEILTGAKYNLLEEGGIVTGQLMRSGYVKKIDEFEYEVGFDAPYSKYVEFGTRPRRKMPPIEPIKQWAKIKFGLTEQEARKVAWAIAKWIKEHGTRPHPYFRPAIYKVLDKYKYMRVQLVEEEKVESELESFKKLDEAIRKFIASTVR